MINKIKIENLSIFNSKNDILVDNINLNIIENAITAIIGESGSGKTITAHSIMGLLPPTLKFSQESKILYYYNHHEVNLLKINKKQWRTLRSKKISMIFQNPMSSLHPLIKCGEQIAEVLKVHTNYSPAKRKENVLEILQQVGFDNATRIYDAYPHQLSGGEQQRVMISMAMISKPEMLIADEPTTALDAQIQLEIINLIKDLKTKFHCTVLFISHDLSLVHSFADYIYVMKSGKIVEHGPTNVIFENPSEEYTQLLLRCKPTLTYTPYRLPTLHQKYDFNLLNATKKSNNIIGDIVLNVENLNVIHQNKTIWGQKVYNHILKNINFNVKSNECLGIIGESGSGKTTLLKTILGLIKPDSGLVEYKGEKLDIISNRTKNLFRSIQWVQQNPYTSLPPNMAIGKHFNAILKLHNIGKNTDERNKIISETLELCQMPVDILDRYPHQFSGGQLQRLAIAQALLVNPEIILLDEPVSSLDVSIQAAIINLLNDIKDNKKITYLFITHDIMLANYFCDSLIVLYKGEIVEQGLSKDIIKKPQHSYTKLLINSY
ncbi:MAG TPA: ABC transporter ATP-binding protein [Bacteroidales bacterium]|jgi:peptide/nickel transport system ATP-binding protein|nr:ABC transporter ATP-binding protein [Bacteroidales bacterium]HQC59134.1 ABC transporter ATP-binding protein [Bacteroidales bacterium]